MNKEQVLFGLPTAQRQSIHAANNVSGVYAIECNGQRYIGMSRNIATRWCYHIDDLQRHTHTATALQNCYDDHGIESFEFTVLETLPQFEALLRQREVYWKLKNKGKLLNNICDRAQHWKLVGDYVVPVTSQLISPNNPMHNFAPIVNLTLEHLYASTISTNYM